MTTKLFLPENIYKTVSAWAECNDIDCVILRAYGGSISFESVGTDPDISIEFVYQDAGNQLDILSDKGFSMRELGINE